MSLIKNGQCFFCKGKFIVKSVKDDLLIRKQKVEETHENLHEIF
tara:strand:+ start:340 stop:471 length:132 start_codon:yes stop_codon:yes gene_type:complete